MPCPKCNGPNNYWKYYSGHLKVWLKRCHQCGKASFASRWGLSNAERKRIENGQQHTNYSN